MKTKQIIAIVVVLLFALSFASISYAKGAAKAAKAAALKGVVTAVVGNEVTIVDAAGVSVTKTITTTQITDAATGAKTKVPGVVGIAVGQGVEIKGTVINLQKNPATP